MAVAKNICDAPTFEFGDIADCPDATITEVVHDICENGKGEVTLMVQNGTPPYSISWTPSVGTPSSPGTISTDGGSFTIADIPANTTRTIDVIDSNGCAQ